jgi:predicted ATP-grasp superfamily ATP-dependent carboligase
MHGGVLTLGCFRSTLIAARSLARAGYTVTAGVDRRSFLAYSRYIRHTWRHGHIHLNGALGRILVEYLAGHPEIQYIFPTGDSSTMLVANHYDQVRQFAVPVMPPPQVAMNCVNKSHAYTVAAVANVLTPPMRRTEGLGELYGAAEEIGYPCIIKPNDSMGDFFGLKAIICRSPSELHRRVPVWPWGDRPLLVQRFITGYRINCDVVAVNGRIMSFFQSRVRRTHRHDNTGLTVDAISVPPDPVVRDRCERIVAAFAYTGVALIQFLRDGEDAEPVFLEINPRLGAYVTFPYHLGYDYPLLAMYCADVLAGRQVAAGVSGRPPAPLADGRCERPDGARGAGAVDFPRPLRLAVANRALGLPAQRVHELVAARSFADALAGRRLPAQAHPPPLEAALPPPALASRPDAAAFLERPIRDGRARRPRRRLRQLKAILRWHALTSEAKPGRVGMVFSRGQGMPLPQDMPTRLGRQRRPAA